MKQGKYYSVQDISNASGYTTPLVADVMQFLSKYGFAERIGIDEPLFTRVKLELSPAGTVKLLECISEQELVPGVPSVKDPVK